MVISCASRPDCQQAIRIAIAVAGWRQADDRAQSLERQTLARDDHALDSSQRWGKGGRENGPWSGETTVGSTRPSSLDRRLRRTLTARMATVHRVGLRAGDRDHGLRRTMIIGRYFHIGVHRTAHVGQADAH